MLPLPSLPLSVVVRLLWLAAEYTVFDFLVAEAFPQLDIWLLCPFALTVAWVASVPGLLKDPWC